MKKIFLTLATGVVAAAAALSTLTVANAEEEKTTYAIGPFKQADGSVAGGKEVVFEDGRWIIEESGNPTYHVSKDGKVDFLSYRGYQRYHAECHVCHGPEGKGSTYAPALVDSVRTMSYEDFVGVVASGRVRNAGGTEYVMPALGDNKNVMCYLDAMYVYLKGLSAEAVPNGRPRNKASKPKEVTEFEDACIAG
ncbi:MAG: c-type cytochrome, methanol metabolism-related [Pseudomonadota bacterium]